MGRGKMDLLWQGDMDRRRNSNRRRKRMPTLQSLFTFRRRRHLRRASDRRSFVLLDYYHPPLMVSVVLVLVLSVIDALLTLFLMAHGAVELNPVMGFFLKFGTVPFILAKYSLTAASVITIVVLNYFFIRHLKLVTRNLLHFFAAGFALVIVWELVLTFRYVY